jgi:hypothetical protein
MADADAEQQPAARNRKSIAVPAPVHAAPLRITKRDIAMAGGDTLLIGLQSFRRGSFGIRTTFVDAPAQSASKSTKKAWNKQRPTTRPEREMGCHPASGVLVGVRLDELVGALMRFGKPRAITEQLARLARQADAALETCEGIDATTLRMGLLCMAECRAQTLARGPESGRREERKAFYGIVFPTTELFFISSSLMVGPTLAKADGFRTLRSTFCPLEGGNVDMKWTWWRVGRQAVQRIEVAISSNVIWRGDAVGGRYGEAVARTSAPPSRRCVRHSSGNGVAILHHAPPPRHGRLARDGRVARLRARRGGRR